MKAAAPAVPKTGTAEKKSIKREGRRTPIRTVLLGGASLCAFGGFGLPFAGGRPTLQEQTFWQMLRCL